MHFLYPKLLRNVSVQIFQFQLCGEIGLGGDKDSKGLEV